MNPSAAAEESRIPIDEQCIACNREMLAQLILQQWGKVSLRELEKTGYDKRKIALLIERKYGIQHTLMENYLSHLERTLPLVA